MTLNITEPTVGGSSGSWGQQLNDALTAIVAYVNNVEANAQPVDSDLTAIAALATTAYGRSLLTQANAAAAQSTLGLGSAATQASSAFDPAGAANTAQAAAISAAATDATTKANAAAAASQPLDSDLTAIAALTTTAFGRSFLALVDAAAARTLLGLGTAATQASTAFAPAGTTGIPSTIVAKTTAYTAAVGDFVQANAAGNGFSVTLPASPAVGALVTVKKVDTSANVVTVIASSSGTIDGDANATITSPQFGGIFEHIGSNAWAIVAPTSAGGSNGVNGNTIQNGVGAPASGVGVNGDFYIDTTNSRLYGPKAAGAWPGSFTSLIGPAGSNGAIAQIQSAGTNVTTRGTVNFIGATVADDAANGRTNVTLTAGGGLPPFNLKSSNYFFAPDGGQGGVWSPGAGYLVWTPIYVPAACTVTAIGANIPGGGAGAAGATIRFGLYNDDGTMRPGTLVVDAGAVAATTTGWIEATISQALNQGIYWVAAVQQGAAASSLTAIAHTIPIPVPASQLTAKVYAFANNGGTTGALPTTAPAPTFYQTNYSNASPRIGLKVA